jgi:acyl-CoA thioesterase-2
MTVQSLPRARERTQALLDLLHLTAGESLDLYVARSARHVAPRVFGGQVLAQAVVAAGRTVPADRTIHSLHAYFLRPGDLEEPITLSVERLRDGRSLSARRVQALQTGQPILSMIASFEIPGVGPEHAEPMPAVPGPQSLESLADTWGTVDNDLARYWAFEQPLDLRFATPSVFVTPQADGDPTTRVWWRVAADLPDDPLLHAAVAVFASDYSILEPVLRRHGRSWLNSGFATASIDHAVWFHTQPRSDRWLLLDATSPAASSSRGLCTGRMYAADGTLVATVAQEGLFRPTR